MLRIPPLLVKKCLVIILTLLCSCSNSQPQHTEKKVYPKTNPTIITAAQQITTWLPKVKGKKIGFVGNHTSIIRNGKKELTHLIDTLMSHQVAIKRVFAPEHGFRGKADAGEHVKNGIDTKTGLPIISLYGKNKKPFPKQLKDIELMVFDIQDVGVRFYTYIATLHYIMEACAENSIPLLLLDRPNPNANYVDGPVLEKEFKSFVGMHPVPIVYGMTIGEYAKMINGEKWLKNGIQCMLEVIPIKNYNHLSQYSLPIKPSPNLPNDISINLYPSLCLFEGTKNISVGRGTNMQFQVYGAPFLKSNFCFTPLPNEGAKHPKNEQKLCCGQDLRSYKKLHELKLNWLIKAYNTCPDKSVFFNSFFEKLVGTQKLRKQIINNVSIHNIKKSWKKDLYNFKKIKKKYLIYN